MNLAAFDLGILGPAFVAGLLVLATHVPLGIQVLNRGIVFIDLAIAQIAGIGVIAADVLGWEAQGWAIQVAATSTALLGALLLSWTERCWPEIQEALIGVLFVLASCTGILLLASNPHGGEHLKDLLVGQILWVGYAQLGVMGIVSAGVLLAWFGYAGKLGLTGFYVLFALAVTASVQLVGVYLVFSSLIIPALATRHLQGKARLLPAYVLGAVAYALGLVLSALWDWPSGAVIVLAMALSAVVFDVLFARIGSIARIPQFKTSIKALETSGSPHVASEDRSVEFLKRFDALTSSVDQLAARLAVVESRGVMTVVQAEPPSATSVLVSERNGAGETAPLTDSATAQEEQEQKSSRIYPPEVQKMAVNLKREGKKSADIILAIQRACGYAPDKSNLSRVLNRWEKSSGSS